MYVRDAKNREEVWLLDHLEAMELDDAGFRSRDYVVAVDETTGEKAGFGRIRVHSIDGEDYCELTSIGVLPEWREQGVGAHVVERLIEYARDEGFETVYCFTNEPGYLTQFGFEGIDASALPEPMQDRLDAEQDRNPDTIATMITVTDFSMPDRLRRRFKEAAPASREQDEPIESAEDFGIDPDETTYKYDL